MNTSPRVVEDGYGGCWDMCERENCDLHVVRPGKVQCTCEFECPCGGEIRYHLDPDPKWPGVWGWFCHIGGPWCARKKKAEVATDTP